MSEWRLIESAPKDGRVVMIRQGKWLPVPAVYFEGRWCAIEFASPLKPTYWMPIGPHQEAEAS